MTSFTVFNERRNYDASTFTVTRNKLKAIEGNVNIAGSRSVDNANFIVPSPVDAKIGDTVSFVADDVDTNELIGAWNFYHNLRDESGYNLDATVTSGTLVYARETLEASRFRGHPYINFNSGNPVITITPTTTENNTTLINFDSDSSIVLWCRVPSLSTGESQIIFDRSDSSNGLRIGVQNSGGTYYAFLQVKGASGSWTTSTLNANVDTAAGKDIMISVEKYSFGSTQYRISVNAGYWNYAIYSGNIENNNTPIIRLGTNYILGERFEGRLYSLRIYTKVLSSSDYTTLFRRKQPFSTMKFAGKVTSINKGNTITTINASGFSSELLLKTDLNKEFTTNLAQDAALATNVTGVYEDKLLEDIIDDIITTVNSHVLDSDDIKYEFVFDNVDDEDDTGSDAWKSTTNQFHMRRLRRLSLKGKLHSLTQLLSILGGKEYNTASPQTLIHNHGADSFFMLPRKVLIFESSDINNNTHFTLGNYNINDGGYDNDSIYNDVTIFGKSVIKFKTVSFSSWNTNFAYDLRDTAFLKVDREVMYISEIYKENNSVFQRFLHAPADYELDDYKLTFKVSQLTNDILVLVIAYIDKTNNSDALVLGSTAPTEDDNSYYYQAQNNTNIKKNGRRTKRYYFPMLEDMTTTAAICRRVLGSHGEQSRKIQIIEPHITNSIQIGSKVTVTNILKKIYNEELTVKSINYKLPSFKSIITVGDYNYDFLDNMSHVLETINSSESDKTSVT